MEATGRRADLALGKALQRAGRSEEAIKAMTDEKYLKELLKEFGI